MNFFNFSSLPAPDIIKLLKEELNLSFSIKGRDYFALCPFHSEKTPSFTFEPEKKIFKCFGCSFGTNNFFKLWSQIKKISLPEARQEIKKLGYEVGPDKNQVNSEDEAISSLWLASQVYQHNLFSIAGQKALNYLYKRRDLDSETIIRFGLGCSVDHHNQLSKLFSSSLSDSTTWAKELILKGLIRNSERNQVYDYFTAGQLIFPCQDDKGEIISFASRQVELEELDINKTKGKYNYLSNNEEYQKSQLLYNYFRVKQMTQENFCYLTEGFFDVISLSKNGIDNCLALLGTSLSKQQLELLRKLKKKIIIFLDGDQAGRQATIKIAIVLLEQDIECEIIDHSYDYDPDEICRFKKEELIQVIQRREDPYSFILNHFWREWEIRENPQSIANFIRKVANLFQSSRKKNHNFLIEKIAKIINWEKLEVEEIYFDSASDANVIKESESKENFLTNVFWQELESEESKFLFACCQDRNYWLIIKQESYRFINPENRSFYQYIYNFYTANFSHQLKVEKMDKLNRERFEKIQRFPNYLAENFGEFASKLQKSHLKKISFLDQNFPKKAKN